MKNCNFYIITKAYKNRDQVQTQFKNSPKKSTANVHTSFSSTVMSWDPCPCCSASLHPDVLTDLQNRKMNKTIIEITRRHTHKKIYNKKKTWLGTNNGTVKCFEGGWMGVKRQERGSHTALSSASINSAC